MRQDEYDREIAALKHKFSGWAPPHLVAEIDARRAAAAHPEKPEPEKPKRERKRKDAEQQ